MIPPTTNELKQHSKDLFNFGNNLHNLNGSGKTLVNAAVIVFALILITSFLMPMGAEVV